MAPNAATRTRALVGFGPVAEIGCLAVLASLVVLNFRAEFHRALPILWVETLIYFMVPVIGLIWVTQRYATTPEILQNRRWIWGIQTAAFVFAMLPILGQFLMRPFGIGDAYEVVALACLLNACWFLAVFSRFGSFDRTAFVFACALVLFVCFMTQSVGVYVFSFFFALVALWWLLGNYWNRVKVKAIDGDSSTLPIRGGAILISAVVVSIVGVLAAAAGPISNTVAVRGLMPSSGGDSWHDAFARSGIGDGDMLTAGKNASTAGPVDSDEFIEDTKPSMYDIMSEKYDGPLVKRKKQNRAVALNANARHMHKKVIQSEQKGKSFRTFRQPKDPKQIELESRKTEALLFVEGQVPARFTMDCFHHFDGWDWTKADLSDEKFRQPRLHCKNNLANPGL